MNKLKILLNMREEKFRWKYVYVAFYAYGNRAVPNFLAKHIAKKNQKNLKAKPFHPINLNTFDRSGQVVHPDLMQRGDELFMVCTPYPYSIELYENPSVYSGKTVFSLTPSTQNPIAVQENRLKGNHLSDPCLLETADGMVIVFRDSIYIDGKVTTKLYYSKSTDGKQWSDQQLFMESETRSFISPALITRSEGQTLYYIQLTTRYGGYLCKVTLNSEFQEKTESAVDCDGLPEGMTLWHISVVNAKDYGKNLTNETGLLGLFTLRDTATGKLHVNYWAHAEDPDSKWIIDEKLDIPADIEREISNVYKSAIIPETGDVLLSFMDLDLRWNLCVVAGDRDRRGPLSKKNLLDSYRVFSRVFHNDMSFAKFKYKHEMNPQPIQLNYLQQTEDGKTIGTNSFMAAQGVSEQGDFLCAQSCDTAVVPEARGKGVFVKIIADAEKQLKQEGIDLLVGFPNNNSYHGFIKLGWQHIGTYKTFIYLTKPLDLILGKLGRPGRKFGAISDKVSVQSQRFGSLIKVVSDKCPFSEEDFKIINGDGKTKQRRDLPFFKWKIDDNDPSFRYLTLRSESLKAYMIYRVNEKGRVLIADWFADSSDDEAYEAYLTELLLSLKEAGNAIVMPFIIANSREEKILKKLKYLYANTKLFKYPVTRMIIKPMTEKGQQCGGNFKSWYLSSIDLDTIII